MFVPLPTPLPIRHGVVDREGWLAVAHDVADTGGRLVSLWGGERVVHAAYAFEDGLAWIELPLAAAASYPDLAGIFPAAIRMQRAAHDLDGVIAEGAADTRPWLDHGLWQGQAEGAEYAFVRVEGDGVHEIAVGPVHAGIIEPGHFRFSVVGEKVLRLEQRLGYVHKGIDRRFTELAPLDGHRLAGRVSGDSTVAFAWAYCMALEAAAGCVISERAQGVRALLLERERIANHLGDLGALGNDAGFGVGLAQFMRLKEDLLRANATVFGARYPMDALITGGVAVDIDPAGIALLQQQVHLLTDETRRLHAIYDEHAGIQDRFMGSGTVSEALARRLGMTGLAARASGIARDLRRDLPSPPYDSLAVNCASADTGDVAARVKVRFDEIAESLRLCADLLRRLPSGAVCEAPTAVMPAGFGVGLVEGWRGPVFVALEAADDGSIRRCHPHDPSWHNWPALEHTIVGDIVADFPLINKSFNLCYSSVDL